MEEKLYPKRWAILAALFICLVTLQFSFIIPGGAALAVMMQYGIDGTLFGMVMSVPYFAGVIFGIFLGTLADRVGVSKVMVVSYVIALIGAVWRAMSGDSFVMLFVSSMVMGVATAALNANSAKVIRAWFPGKQANLAFGVYVCGASLGAALALQIGARLTATDVMFSPEGIPLGLVEGASGVQMCWWLSAILTVVSIVFWFLLYREHPDGIAVEEPIMQHMGYALKKKSVWGISLVAFLFMGCTVVGTSYMVAAIQTVYGADATTAANISTLVTVVICVGCVVLPSVVARFKHTRPVFWVLLIGSGVGYMLGLQVPFLDGMGPTILFVFGAIFFAPMMSMVKMLPALLPDVEPKYLGAVGGFQSVMQNLGMFLVSSYIIAPICGAMYPPVDGVSTAPFYQAIFIGLFICCVLTGIVQYMYPNLRCNVEDMLADKAAAAEKSN